MNDRVRHVSRFLSQLTDWGPWSSSSSKRIDRIDCALATEDTEIRVHNLSFLMFRLLWLSVVDLHISDEANQKW
jgi:hypothetical protein